MNSTRIQLPPALNLKRLSELREAIALHDDVIVLEGTQPGTFCTGLDVVSTGAATESERTQGLGDFETAILRLLTGDRAAIALVDGDALGGGLGLAAACDLVIASPTATFGLPEPLFGLIPGMITPVVRTRITAPVLRRMALSGVSISADEAHQIGLVDVIAEPDRFDGLVKRWTRQFRRSYPPAVARLKTWLTEMDDIAAQIREGRVHLATLLCDPEVERRARRFRDGEIPWENE